MIFCTPRLYSSHFANTAFGSAAIRPNVRIFWRPFVPMRAVRFIDAVIGSPKRVFSIGHYFHMIRVYATANPTQMINLQALGNWSFIKPITYTVCQLRAAFVIKRAVSLAVKATIPKPAARIGLRLNLIPESIFRSACHA